MSVPARLSIAEYEALSHHDVTLGDERIHYVDEGEGFPLVLVRGSPTTSALWRHQLPTLSKRFRVIAPDVLGFGRSVAQDEDGKRGHRATDRPLKTEPESCRAQTTCSA